VSGFGIWSGPPTGGWANVALTGDVAAPNPERGFPRTPPPTAAGLCSACDMDGKGGTPADPDWEVEEAINKDKLSGKAKRYVNRLKKFKSLHSYSEDGRLR